MVKSKFLKEKKFLSENISKGLEHVLMEIQYRVKITEEAQKDIDNHKLK